MELPEWLLSLLDDEGAVIDPRRITGRLAKAGVTELGWLGFAGGPDALIARGPGLEVKADVSDRPAPIATALEELVSFVQDFGALRKFHAADQDMDLVAYAARELANARIADNWSHPLLQQDQVLETGIVTMYARNFTGNADLGDSWRPPAGSSRDLHEWIMKLRMTVYAHADWTASRTIVDTNAALGGTGPAILAESRSGLSHQELLAIAELAEAQQLRFNAESGRLKHRLGAANAPSPLER